MSQVRDSRLWLAVPVVLLLAALAFALFRPGVASKARPKPVGSGKPERATDAGDEVSIERLVGSWGRTDGDYFLDLSEPGADGRLSAHYFNPGPINVGHAEWRRDQSELLVFVELRDTNYPGSTYGLKYSVVDDRLSGTYYQAAVGERYDVEFMRLPQKPGK